ncbi:Mov34/MPN/PAD-1 family protein [Pectobacterium polaris]|uniref:Mov34/MPN/PAD-1 family protein n=1 Tax=Pectobacterium polaris TaxID=2042057 RepID=UPI0023B12465|nr:Mov34/MPN/PAD-1 family protein [Pectobacterium polaris]MDE8741838.1 Mov34/MPN/PAD-1 family protein [Pectobacterium polaris]
MTKACEAPQSRLARSVIQYLNESPNHPYAILLSIGREGTNDILDIELEIELEQRRQVPIRPREPVRLIFTLDDSRQPWVLSTREDFPVGLVHTTLDREGDGLALCIWEEAWSDLATNLTGQACIERIRTWFSSMSAGTIHDDDQVLEPLIHSTAHTLIIPSGQMHGPWYTSFAYKHCGFVSLGLSKEKPEEEITSHNFAIYTPELPSQLHRGLTNTPFDLGALQRLCLSFGFDLIEGLVQWLHLPEQLNNALSSQPLLILTVPKRRATEASDEEPEVWCYTLGQSLAELGELLGVTITEPKTKQTTQKIFGHVDNENLSLIKMVPWRVVKRLDRAAARNFAGTTHKNDTFMLAIGAGAIGSNVTMIATRSGIGPWVLIDGDITLPHNTVRQVQRNSSVGFPKASVLQIELNNVFDEDGNTAIPVNVFAPGERTSELNTALCGSEIAVDFSASPAVLGWLSDQQIKRGVSAFFGPDGSDLVVLAEDKFRTVRVDEIEAQYFWAVATETRMKGHLAAARVDHIRYANACQDLSRPLPPWRLQTLCGLAAGQLAQLVESDKACFKVWRLQPETGDVQALAIPVQSVSRFKTESIRVSISNEVIAIMRKLRIKSGRNETGGVLIGTFDLVRNVLHVIAALPAPPDSKQAPTYFIRGVENLKPLVEKLADSSAGRLHYIGEWHSHPGAIPARPSSDDESVYAHLKKHIGSVGAPYIMAICGDRDTWFRVGWTERSVLEGVVTHG